MARSLAAALGQLRRPRRRRLRGRAIRPPPRHRSEGRPRRTASKPAPGPSPSPPDQLEHLKIAPVATVAFRPEVQTTGTVAFDGDLSTQVLAPISGPVMRILVQPGAWVKRGEALAIVSSPDFAAAVADFRKAQATAVQARRVADARSALFKNDAIARRDLEQAQTDASVGGGGSRRRAAGAAGARRRCGHARRAARQQPVGDVQGVIRAPIERHGGREADQSGAAPAGGHARPRSRSPISRPCG